MNNALNAQRLMNPHDRFQNIFPPVISIFILIVSFFLPVKCKSLGASPKSISAYGQSTGKLMIISSLKRLQCHF